jgi:hypothetical protein
MKQVLLLFLSVLLTLISFAGKIFGTVTDAQGNILPYASILVKGTTKGTTANNQGIYQISLDPGTYTFVCQHVGYKREEKSVSISAGDVTVDFQLEVQQLVLGEVIVKKGEDPAYEIIRNAIKKRSYYQSQVKAFQCEVYTKGQLKLRSFPAKLFGQKVDLETGDTSKNQILYLSETIAIYAVKEPDQSKIEVVSTKVSGQSDGFGLSAPQIMSFYDNKLVIGTNLNPRGFISPISNNALNYYRYKYEGAFFEDGRQISRIRVFPKRKYEPLFSGYINIVENDWRIHSLRLELTKESQMQYVDTLRIEQLYVPVTNDVWFIKSQVIYPAIKMFGFDAYGNFVNIYSKLNLDPNFKNDFFNKTVLKYTESSNKKDSVYWDAARPVPLQEEESADYRKKAILELARKDPHYLDSIDKKRNKFSALGFIATGYTISNEKKRTSISIQSLIKTIKYNPVEGLVINPVLTYLKRIDTGMGRRAISLTPNLRYGFSNHHFNAFETINYAFGKKYPSSLIFSGGKRVFQFNNYSLQGEAGATLSALFFEHNRRKIYEAWFGKAQYEKSFGGGFKWDLSFQYQDRMPLHNTTDFKIIDRKSVQGFTPNYPEEFIGPPFVRHQASIASATIIWQPDKKYIEFPGKTLSIGSSYPILSLSYIKGLYNFLGSDVKYDKWRFGLDQDINFDLAGRFSYRLSTGGFINDSLVQIPDYFHLNGNASILAASYLNGFQLAAHYQFSNTKKLFTTVFIEHHFDGFLTNKIPGLRKLNWWLEGGVNAFYANKNLYYYELFAGLENIFKLIRVDFVQGWLNGKSFNYGVRIGIKGIVGGKLED